jgi:hypothetical protein
MSNKAIDLDLSVGLQRQVFKSIAVRDADDWMVFSCATAVDCPVWTEDVGYFGAGIATWTADRVDLYFVE